MSLRKLGCRGAPSLLFALFYTHYIEYYSLLMDFLFRLLARTLEAMFVIGMIGSLGVLLVSFVEDIETLFDMEDSSHW